MNVKKIHFVVDKTKKAKILSKRIIRKYKNHSPKISDVIVVSGGDGFMLQILKKYQKYNKPFYGINRGTYGFLMNKFNSYDIERKILETKLTTISPLEMSVRTKNKKNYSAIAINEISLLRQTKQTASLKIIAGKKILIKKLVCDGVLIATPAGSTAYNLSVNGPILSLNSKKLAITSISPFRPRRWKGKIISSTTSICVNNLNIQKRPVSVVADNVEIRNVMNVKIRMNNNIKFKLLYNRSSTLNKKIKLEQIKKIRN